jgi:hypothetical protein
MSYVGHLMVVSDTSRLRHLRKSEYWDSNKGGDKVMKALVARMFGIEPKTFLFYVW